MVHFDQFSQPQTAVNPPLRRQSSMQKRDWYLTVFWMVLLILTLIALTGCSAVASGSQPAQAVVTLQPTAPPEAPAEATSTPTSTPVNPGESTVSDKGEMESSAISAAQGEAAPPPAAAPELGEITFALGG